jgi:hypothetical protein
MNKLISYRYNRSILLGETSGQLTGGVGAKTYINSTIVYPCSLIAEIWFKSEHCNLQNSGDLSRVRGVEIKIMPYYKFTVPPFQNQSINIFSYPQFHLNWFH